MDELQLRRSVAEILEVSPDELNETAELDSFATYDSTASLSLMVCLSDLSGCNFELRTLQKLRTYGDIVRLMEQGSGNG